MSTKKILKDANCKMQVVCGKQWDALDQTEEDGIRFCGDCKKLVFYTQTSAELRIAARNGLCVFIVPNSNAANANNPDVSAFTHIGKRIGLIEPKALRSLRRSTMGVAIARDLTDDE